MAVDVRTAVMTDAMVVAKAVVLTVAGMNVICEAFLWMRTNSIIIPQFVLPIIVT